MAIDNPQDDLAGVRRAILAQLRSHPAGLSEFELIRCLQQGADAALPDQSLADPVILYRTHFLVFHCLYQLREHVRGAGEDLEIHCLQIKLVAAQRPQPGALGASDELAAFYLDLNNLEGVGADEVRGLLSDFWRRFSGYETRDRALAVLELEDPVDAVAIKRQYRRLVMRHHPDRGGDKEALQRLNQAMEQLDEA